MAFKFLNKETIHDSEEFHIKEAGWRETRELHQVFKDAFSDKWKGVPSSKFVLVALDKKSGKVIGGIESAVDIKLALADEKSFAVSPEFRDKGVGTALLQTMHNELKRLGVRKVTTVPTEKSWNIFRKHGYDYPPAMKAELRIRNLDEKGYAEGAKLVKLL